MCAALTRSGELLGAAGAGGLGMGAVHGRECGKEGGTKGDGARVLPTRPCSHSSPCPLAWFACSLASSLNVARYPYVALLAFSGPRWVVGRGERGRGDSGGPLGAAACGAAARAGTAAARTRPPALPPHLPSPPPCSTRLITCVEGRMGPQALLEVLQAGVADHGGLLWQEAAERQQRVRGREGRGSGGEGGGRGTAPASSPQSLA
jgi:hypothetical protein